MLLFFQPVKIFVLLLKIGNKKSRIDIGLVSEKDDQAAHTSIFTNKLLKYDTLSW